MEDTPTLTDAEIFNITHRKRPKEQMRDLIEMGIPAFLRKHDNTVCVLRMHVTVPQSIPVSANDEPQLKSSRK